MYCLTNCVELLSFQLNSLSFAGAKIGSEPGIEYAVKMKDRLPFNLIGSNKMLEMWPIELIDFLEAKMVFAMPPVDANAQIQLAENVVGLPDQIIGNCYFHFILLIFIITDKFYLIQMNVNF